MTVYRARKIQRFLSQPFQVAEVFTGSKGQFVSLPDTIKGFRDILNGKYDHFPENAFYMVGNIDTVIQKAEKIAADMSDKPTDATFMASKITATNDEIRAKLKAAADNRLQKDLAKAAAIKEKKAKEADDGILPGWNFPTEDKIRAQYAEWERTFAAAPDIEEDLRRHFDAALVRVKREREAEAAELAN